MWDGPRFGPREATVCIRPDAWNGSSGVNVGFVARALSRSSTGGPDAAVSRREARRRGGRREAVAEWDSVAGLTGRRGLGRELRLVPWDLGRVLLHPARSAGTGRAGRPAGTAGGTRPRPASALLPVACLCFWGPRDFGVDARRGRHLDPRPVAGMGGAQGSGEAHRCTVEMHKDVAPVGPAPPAMTPSPVRTRARHVLTAAREASVARQNCDDGDRGAMGLRAGRRPPTASL